MSTGDSERVYNHFAANSRDVTPALARHAAHVLYAPVSNDPEVTRRCAAVLSDTELRRAERFARQQDQALFKQRRAFRRYCGALVLESPQPLSQIVFNETENGRPYLADLPKFWFGFSSCRCGFLGAWSSTHGIAVDLEDQKTSLQATDIARQFFSVAEVKAVEQPGGAQSMRIFFQLWTLKEAALKSIGEGLPFGLDAFEFELAPDLRVVRTPPRFW